MYDLKSPSLEMQSSFPLSTNVCDQSTKLVSTQTIVAMQRHAKTSTLCHTKQAVIEPKQSFFACVLNRADLCPSGNQPGAQSQTSFFISFTSAAAVNVTFPIVGKSEMLKNSGFLSF